jgi:sulfite exporter TauE/SafE
MAGTASAVTGTPLGAALFMFIFGLGTLPVLLLAGIYRENILKVTTKLRHVPIAPIGVSVVALVLILRGAGLGIPYLSPASSDAGVTCPACKAPKSEALLGTTNQKATR